MMNVFNAKVRLGGTLENEVVKRGLTVPEIIILRRLHGNDALVAIEHAGVCEIDPIEERERLDFIYGNGLAHLHEDQKTSVEKLFGGDYTPLPEELRDFDGAESVVEKSLSEFQEPEPFVSPNIDDRAAAIRKKADAKKIGRKEAVKSVPPVKTAKKSALDAVV